MTWTTEMVTILRHLINDLDSSSYTYTNSRLQECLVVAAQLLSDMTFIQSYTLDYSTPDINPDPSATATRDVAFINLVCLRAACMLSQGETKTAATQAVAIRDGQSALDLKGPFEGKKFVTQSMCKTFEDTKRKFEIEGYSGGVGKAIISPYKYDGWPASRSHIF